MLPLRRLWVRLTTARALARLRRSGIRPMLDSGALMALLRDAEPYEIEHPICSSCASSPKCGEGEPCPLCKVIWTPARRDAIKALLESMQRRMEMAKDPNAPAAHGYYYEVMDAREQWKPRWSLAKPRVVDGRLTTMNADHGRARGVTAVRPEHAQFSLQDLQSVYGMGEDEPGAVG